MLIKKLPSTNNLFAKPSLVHKIAEVENKITTTTLVTKTNFNAEIKINFNYRD